MFQGVSDLDSPERIQERVVNARVNRIPSGLGIALHHIRSLNRNRSNNSSFLVSSHNELDTLLSALSHYEKEYLAAEEGDWEDIERKIDESLEKVGLIAAHFGLDDSNQDLESSFLSVVTSPDEGGHGWLSVTKEIENSLTKAEVLAHRLGLDA